MTFRSTYVSADGVVHETARRAGAIARALDRGAVGSAVVAAVGSRAELASLVVGALATGRTVVMPHGFAASVVARLAHEHDATIVHDREGGLGLDLRPIDSEGAESLDPTSVLADHRDRTALIFSTSGTTGTPRPIGKVTAQLLDEAETLASHLRIEDGEAFALGVPSTHLFGFLFGIALPTARALRIHAGLVRTGVDLGPAFVPDRFVGAPPTIHSFVRSVGIPTRFEVVSSGAELSAEIAAEAHAAGASRVVEIFGSTETGGIGTRDRGDGLFVPLPGVALGRHEPTTVTSPFTAGESVELTDRFEFEGEGFRFVGRDADLAKIGGRRISVGAVEARLRAIPGVTDAAVRARPSTSARGSRLAALVVGDVDLDAIRAFLATELDPEFLPRPLVRVASIARSPSGKQPIASFERQLEDGIRLARAGIGFRAIEGGFEFRIREDSSRFEGHFPGHPILPGVSSLLDLVLPAIHASDPAPGHPRRMTRVKFRRPILPGNVLVCTLSRKGLDQLVFELRTDAGDAVASGNLDFADTRSFA